MTIAASQPRHKYSLVACARWETNDIVEWIEYHRAVGFEHFYIYSNDDSPIPLLKVLTPYLLRDDPCVTYRHWPVAGQQPEIYYHFLRTFKDQTEWFSFLDIDEFFVFKNIDSVSAFMSRFESSYDAVYFNWLLYGHNGYIERAQDSVLLSYQRRSRNINHHTKVITRSSAVDAEAVEAKFRAGALGFWHFWNEYIPDLKRVTNVLRDSVEGYTSSFPENALKYVRTPHVSDAMIATAYVAHFQIKSEQDFRRRAERGGFEIAARWGEMFSDGSYRGLLNHMNEVEDAYLAGFWAKRTGTIYQTAASNPVPVPGLTNVAIRKPSKQSSIFAGEIGVSAGHRQGHGNDGFRSGACGFHTAFEQAPWWVVDLLDLCVIHEVHVYNRVDAPGVAERASNIALEISESGEVWDEILALDGNVFFGVRGGPLVFKAERRLTARFLRIVSRVPTLLHLDEVEIYGTPASALE